MSVGVLLGSFFFSALLLLLVPERPLVFVLGDLHSESDWVTVRNVLRRLFDTTGVRRAHVVALIAHFVLICAAMFGFQVYSNLLQNVTLAFEGYDAIIAAFASMAGVLLPSCRCCCLYALASQTALLCLWPVLC